MALQPSQQTLTSFKALGIGMELVTAVGGLAILGYFADDYFGTEPWLVFTGVVLGVIGGCYNAVKQVQRMDAQRKRETSKRNSKQREL